MLDRINAIAVTCLCSIKLPNCYGVYLYFLPSVLSLYLPLPYFLFNFFLAFYPSLPIAPFPTPFSFILISLSSPFQLHSSLSLPFSILCYSHNLARFYPFPSIVFLHPHCCPLPIHSSTSTFFLFFFNFGGGSNPCLDLCVSLCLCL